MVRVHHRSMGNTWREQSSHEWSLQQVRAAVSAALGEAWHCLFLDAFLGFGRSCLDDAPLLCSCFFTLLSKRRRIEHMHGIEGPMVASGHAVCLLLPPWSSDYTGNATKILPLVLLNNRTLSAVGPGLSSRWSLRPDSTQRFCATILSWCTSICGLPRKPGTRWNICRYSTLTLQ